MYDKAELSDQLQAACLEIAAVCRKHKLRSLQATIRPGFRMDDSEEIELRWDWGRHGAKEDEARMTYTKRVICEIPVDPPAAVGIIGPNGVGVATGANACH